MQNLVLDLLLYHGQQSLYHMRQVSHEHFLGLCRRQQDLVLGLSLYHGQQGHHHTHLFHLLLFLD